MMDLSFWPVLLIWKTLQLTGFNPCYDGFVFLTSMLVIICLIIIVSILVMMDLSFWLSVPENPAVHLTLFQSLLWWICLFDSMFCLNLSSFCSSFNPCYDGFVFLTHYSCSVMLVRSSGFNPCYDGFVFLTYLFVYFYFESSMFQSLLWWICLFDYSGLLTISCSLSFQSLLWWICLFDHLVFVEFFEFMSVSILVMMDLSFWPLNIKNT